MEQSHLDRHALRVLQQLVFLYEDYLRRTAMYEQAAELVGDDITILQPDQSDRISRFERVIVEVEEEAFTIIELIPTLHDVRRDLTAPRRAGRPPRDPFRAQRHRLLDLQEEYLRFQQVYSQAADAIGEILKSVQSTDEDRAARIAELVASVRALDLRELATELGSLTAFLEPSPERRTRARRDRPFKPKYYAIPKRGRDLLEACFSRPNRSTPHIVMYQYVFQPSEVAKIREAVIALWYIRSGVPMPGTAGPTHAAIDWAMEWIVSVYEGQQLQLTDTVFNDDVWRYILYQVHTAGAIGDTDYRKYQTRPNPSR